MFLTGKAVDDARPEGADAGRGEEGARSGSTRQEGRRRPPPAAAVQRPRQAGRGRRCSRRSREFFARAIVNRTVAPLLRPRPGHAARPDALARTRRATRICSRGWPATWRRTSTTCGGLIRGIVLSQAYARSSHWTSESGPGSDARSRSAGSSRSRRCSWRRRSRSRPPTRGRFDEPSRRSGEDGWSSSKARPAASPRLRPADRRLPDRRQRGPAVQQQRPGREEFLADGSDRCSGGLRRSKRPGRGDRAASCGRSSRRPPTADEQRTLLEYVSRRDDRRPEAYRQMLWALISGAEFRFNY